MKFENKQIKDICRFVGGSQPPKSKFINEPREGYVRLIQIRDRLNDNFITFIPENSTTKFCEPEDILIGRYGPPIFQVFRGFKGAYNVAIMKADPLNGVDNDYLYYFLIQDSVFKYVDSMSARTAGQTGVELDSLYEYPVKLPDERGQKQIVNVLKSIDDKIANNNAINENLEKMAKTIYEYWFLQYEFLDDCGKRYKTAGGQLKWDEELKREIPSQWSCGFVGDLFDSQAGYAFKSSMWTEKGHPVLTIKAINEDGSINMDYATYISEYDSSLEKYSVRNGNMIFAMSGNTIGKLGIVASETENVLINQRVLILKTDADSIAYTYFLLKDKKIQNIISQLGANSAQPNISEDSLRGIRICLPERKILDKYNKICKPYFETIIHNRIENQRLSALRDFLLPMLMNGQIDFAE